MRALQVEPQLELAREPRTTDVFWNQREPPDDALARVVRRRVPQQKDVRELDLDLRRGLLGEGHGPRARRD